MPYATRLDARRDANEPDIRKAVAALGGVWIPRLPVDAFVGVGGVWLPVEVKNPEVQGRKHEFTKVEREFMAECDAKRLPVAVWRTVEDVIATVNQIRGER